jgi:hypothetical protein
MTRAFRLIVSSLEQAERCKRMQRGQAKNTRLANPWQNTQWENHSNSSDMKAQRADRMGDIRVRGLGFGKDKEFMGMGGGKGAQPPSPSEGRGEGFPDNH